MTSNNIHSQKTTLMEAIKEVEEMKASINVIEPQIQMTTVIPTEETILDYDFRNEEVFKEYGNDYFDVDELIYDMKEGSSQEKANKLTDIKMIFSHKIRKVIFLKKFRFLLYKHIL